MTSTRETGPSESVVIVVIIGLCLCLISYAALSGRKRVQFTTRATITELALTGLWTRTRPCVGLFRGLAGCNHVPFLADFITNTSGSDVVDGARSRHRSAIG